MLYATVQSAFPSEFVARMVMVPEPEAVGVPEIVRVDVLNVIPAGRLPCTA